MDLMFTAEQYAAAHATAAAVAAAQYYAMNAIGNSHSAANMLVTSTAGGFGLMPTPVMAMSHGLHPGAMSEAQLASLGHQFHVASEAQQQQQQQEDLGRERSRTKIDDDFRKDRQSDRHRDRDHRERGDRRDRDHRGERDRSRDRRDRRDPERRDTDRRRDRSRDRSPRRESRRDRSPHSDDDLKNASPNNTIMVRGLAQHISENDIRQDITQHGLIARDIRLIRKKETGASRGFAFVEFAKIEDAKIWMDAKQGILLFKDQYRAIMQYSLPRDGRPGDPPKVLHDWICANCGVQNFRRRDHCFKCNGPKTDGGLEGADEVSTHPTGTVLLRGLDALSTEDSVLNCLKTLTQLPIKSIRIGRDPLTNTSRGVCYVEMNAVVDAMFLHNQLLGEPPSIDDKLVSVSYYRSPQSGQNLSTAAANAALAAAQWSHQGQQDTVQVQPKYSDDDIERLAEYSSSLYAKTDEEKTSYLDYYRNYYRNGCTEGSVTPATAASNKPKAEAKAAGPDLGMVMVDGVEYKKYPVPDVSSYVYDEPSGYYYDAQTTLYYDVNSQYYFNSTANQFMYWSAEHQTYLPAPDQQQDPNKKEDRKDKVKTAKRIAKDMERWAKTLNQRKEAARLPVSTYSKEPPSTSVDLGLSSNVRSSISGAEDIAFSMMQKKPMLTAAATAVADRPSMGLAGLASYGSDSDDESGNPTGAALPNGGPESQLTDWSKIACLLCKRQFPSKEKLQKHNQVSDLHKQNLDSWRRSKKCDDGQEGDVQQSGSRVSFNDAAQAQSYRDRAKERRQKYGEDDAPKPNRLKEKYLKVMEEVETVALPEKNIDSTNIGNKMLQKMGWKEGLGLGKANQGRTSIVEADRRAFQAGLGSGGQIRSNPNDSYKDCVKKTMFQRYQDLS